MKSTICIFIFCLIIAFLLCIPFSPTLVQSQQESHHSGQLVINNRLAFESIIAIHNTYFIVFIAGLSVYFGIVGACWKFAFGDNDKAPAQKYSQPFLLAIATIASAALCKGMWLSLSDCTARQEYLNDLATKLGISQINLHLLPSSAKISIYVIAILGTASLIATIVVLVPLCSRKKEH